MASELSPQAGRILDCAQVLITAGGYNAFSYADISAEVGITKASIHHHFAKKSDLVRLLVQRYRAAAVDGLASLAAGVPDPLARLQAYTAWWSACIGDASQPLCVCAMLGAELPALPADVAVEVRLHFTHLAGWLEAAMAAGEAGGSLRLSASPAVHSQAFLATVHGAMLSARACADPSLFETIVGSTLAQLATR
jgi:TetR/AcrR family transcriptional repressor of nem operon